MDKLTTRVSLGLVIIALLVGGLYFKGQPAQEPLMGGINEVSNYQQFTGAIATTTVLKSGVPGSFNGVVITEDSATAVVFYDATSSAAVSDGTYATRIADFPATATEGTYMFNVGFNRGLVMQSTDGFSFAGDWTVLFN